MLYNWDQIYMAFWMSFFLFFSLAYVKVEFMDHFPFKLSVFMLSFIVKKKIVLLLQGDKDFNKIVIPSYFYTGNDLPSTLK